MAIIALITTVVIISYPENLQKQDELDLAIEELVSNIRRIQHMALATEQCGEQSAAHFGIKKKTPNSYEIYCNSNNQLEIINLPAGIIIQNGKVEFKPPYAEPDKYTQFDIRQDSIIKLISINNNGQIQVQ